MSERWPGEPTKLDELDAVEEDEVEEAEELPGAEDAEDAEDADEDEVEPLLRAPGDRQHAEGELDIPDDINVIEGEPDGTRRGVAIVASRYNGEITNKLLASALEELTEAGV